MFLHIIIINILIYVGGCSISAPETQIPQGVLRGQYVRTSNNRKISAFTGIPYAKPPVGDLRFEVSTQSFSISNLTYSIFLDLKVPQPPLPWNGILNASRPRAVCPQLFTVLGGTEPQGDEDCLFVNVYTPRVSTNLRF